MRDRCADDFGHIKHKTPEGVLLPGSADDVAKMIQWTAQRGCKFAPRGQSHSIFGRSQVQAGIVADMSPDLGQFGQVALSPIRRSAISSPLLRMPSEELCYAFNLIRIPATEDTDEVNRLINANEATYRRVKAAGGTVYPVSALPLSRAEWREHFGSAFGRLSAAKHEFDPDKILTPGYEIF